LGLIIIKNMSEIKDLWFFSKRQVSSSLTIILATHEPSILLKWFQGLTCFMVTFPAFNPRVSPFAFSLAWLPLFPLYDMLPPMSHPSSYSDSKVGQTTWVSFLAFNLRVSSRPFTWCPLHGSLPSLSTICCHRWALPEERHPRWMRLWTIFQHLLRLFMCMFLYF